MEMIYKPDLEEAKKRWRAFWAGEVLDRPVCAVKAPKNGAAAKPYPRHVQGVDGDYRTPLEMFEEWLSQMYYGGEAIPHFQPNMGPDHFAFFVGSDLEYNPDSEGTTWAVPFVKDWDKDAKDIDKPHGPWWDRMLEYLSFAREYAAGKFVIGVLDMHGNMDLLSAIRSPQYLCMDLLDCPEKIDEAMLKAHKGFEVIYDTIYEVSGHKESGAMGWISSYSEKKFCVTQCDFACMISPSQFRRWVVPALEKESTFLDHTIYHYDGPDALVHLDDVLAIPGIHAIQWVPGAGNPPVIEWMDLLKKIQGAGKGLYLAGSIDEIKYYHKNLRPEGVFYDTWAPSQKEADELLKWLKDNM